MTNETPPNVPGEKSADRLIALPIELIDRDPKQPRKYFDEKKMVELAASIKEFGVIEPIVVRAKANGRYQLIAGERRWRASQKVGLLQIPAIVRERQGKTEALVSLVENIQRSDLDAISIAESIRETMDSTGISGDEVGRCIGKTSGYIHQHLGLLKLGPRVRMMVRTGEISYVCAHVLRDLAPADQERYAAIAKAKGLQAMAIRALISKGKKPPPPLARSVSTRDLELRLQRALGCKVQLKVKSKDETKGRIVIDYSSLDELDRVVDKML
jgi:ParB family chromosome partitioning protein